MNKDKVIIAYKGFGKNMQCRGYQYAIGQTYTHDGNVEACESGFHSCEYPLDIFRYYTPADSHFAIVEASGNFAWHSEDSKVASSCLTVKASIDLSGIVTAAIEYTISRARPSKSNINKEVRGAASNSGDRGAASNSGKHGVAADFNGYYSRAKSCESGAIVCINRDYTGTIRHIRSSKVGENGIKPDVWYTVDDAGEFKEAV